MGAGDTASLAGRVTCYVVNYVPYFFEHVCQESVNDCFQGVNIAD